MTDALRDLETRSDIHDLVVGFYRELVMDDLLGPVFEEVAEVDWATHIPLLIDYWCRVLLDDPSYAGSILRAHRHVHDREAFTAAHFDRWFGFWARAVDQGWSGPQADRAKSHAVKIGGSLARRVAGISWQPVDVEPEPPTGSGRAATDQAGESAFAVEAHVRPQLDDGEAPDLGGDPPCWAHLDLDAESMADVE